MTVALYPGSFDPLTLGHLDLIERGCRLFDRLVVGVAENTTKNQMFTPEERVRIIRHDTAHLGDVVEVALVNGLVVDYCTRHSIACILRGVRTLGDFESEYQMAQMNKKLASSVDTIFLPPAEAHANVSSSLIKEIVKLGGDASAFVSEHVIRELRTRFQQTS